MTRGGRLRGLLHPGMRKIRRVLMHRECDNVPAVQLAWTNRKFALTASAPAEWPTCDGPVGEKETIT